MTNIKMKKNKDKVLLFLLIAPILTFFMIQCKPADKEVSKGAITNVAKKQVVLIGQRLIKAAQGHLGKPYLGHTLDKTVEEKLVVRMDGFDCTTLVETVVAEVLSPKDIKAHVQKTRYRNGEITDYASRIHYFTEWIYENQKNGIVTDITPSIPCSKPYAFTANFMSKNRTKYNQLKTDDVQWNKIKDMEARINKYAWMFIPKSEINKCKSAINHGDIIVITTNIGGLETSHLGFAYKKGAEVHLLHASSDEKKVVITTKTLQGYLVTNSKQTGIMVVRLNEME
jgi:hypothetical protein